MDARAHEDSTQFTTWPKRHKKLVAQYGDRPICVRYRYDGKKKKRWKTVELIVEEADWEPPKSRMSGNSLVGLRIGLNEKELQERVKRAGGKWDPKRRVWDLRLDKVQELGLEKRIAETKSIYE